MLIKLFSSGSRLEKSETVSLKLRIRGAITIIDPLIKYINSGNTIFLSQSTYEESSLPKWNDATIKNDNSVKDGKNNHKPTIARAKII